MDRALRCLFPIAVLVGLACPALAAEAAAVPPDSAVSVDQPTQPAAPASGTALGATEPRPAVPSDVVPVDVKEEPETWPSAFLKSLKFSGYVETSYTYNLNDPVGPPGGPENSDRVFDLYSNEFMLNGAMLTIERPADEENLVGFKVSPFVGQDAEVTQAVGLFKDFDPVTGVATSDSSFDVLNAYVEGYIPGAGTRIKVGKWETTAGAEVIQGPYNDNFSRSFLFGYAIPYTHTGLLAIQPVLQRPSGDSEMFSVGAGVSNGWDNVRDFNDAKALHGVGFFTPCDEFSLTGTYIYSFSEQVDVKDAPRQLIDVVGTVRPLPFLKLMGNFDWGREDEAIAGRDARWWGAAGIVRVDFSLSGDERKEWYLAARGEYFDDRDGARLPQGIGGGARVWEVTGTLGWMPTENLLLRAEVRHDDASSPIFFGDGGTQSEDQQTTLAFSAAFLF